MKGRVAWIIVLTLAAIACGRQPDPLQPALAAWQARDYPRALQQLQPLAQRGDARAQFLVAVIYREGRGVQRDDSVAAYWCRQAAQQGHARAQFNLGMHYLHGRGVAQDTIEAVRWFQKAGEQGIAQAEFNVGVAYSTGQGLPQDPVLAYVWFSRAALHGDAQSRQPRELLARQLSREDLERAQTILNTLNSAAGGDS